MCSRKIIILRMNDPKIKLNDIVTPKQIANKRRGPIHMLNNSLKRNTIIGTNFFPEHLPYEAKLPQIRLPRKDISHMLRYLLKKQQMNVPDKNLVRRILVNCFDQDLISEGSQQFVNHIEIMEGKQGEIVYPENRKFYMILKGEVIIKTENLQYSRCQGDTFGELEIMAGSCIEEMWFQRYCLIVTMDQQNYETFFAPRFNNIYSNKEAELLCMQTILHSIPLFCKFLFLSTVQEKVYQLGDKIVEKGEPLEYLYVVADRFKEQRLKYLSKGCVGLHQIQFQRQVYQETVFCPFNNMKIPCFHKYNFLQYVNEFWKNAKAMQSSIMMESSMIFKSVISITNPQNKIVNFMRIKRVKLPSKRSKTETFTPIQSQFRFLKDQNTIPPSRTAKKIVFDSMPPSRNKNFSLCLKKTPKSTFIK